MKPSSSKTVIYKSGNLILKSTEELGPLVLGDCNSAMDKKIHKEFNIQTIISIGQQAMPIKAKLPQNCSHYFYDIHDNKSQKVPPQLYDEINKLIEEGRKNGGVLVHCYAGVSRSSSFVIGYIMQKFHKSYQLAKQEVKSARNCIYPNEGFVYQLKNYWKELQKREEQRLRKLQQQKRLQIQKSLIQSARKSIRGGVRGASLSPQKIKQKDQQLKKIPHEFMIEPIQMNNPIILKKHQISNSKMTMIKNNIQIENVKDKRVMSQKHQSKDIFSIKPTLNSARKKEELKLPKVNEKSEIKTVERVGTKSEYTMVRKQKIKPVVTIKQSQQISRYQKNQKSQTADIKREGTQQSSLRSVNKTSVKDSTSVYSIRKQKFFTNDIDYGLLNENEKKVKKIYQTKVVVK